MLTILREKTVLTLVVLVLAGAAIGFGHSRAQRSGKPYPLQDAVCTVVRPSSVAFHTTFSVAGQVVRVARPRKSLLHENADLRKEVKRLRAQNSTMQELAAENARLRAALGLARASGTLLIPAEVISRKESSWFDTATVDRGRRAGIAKGWAVVTPSGLLVGQVLEADTFSARVVALTEQNSAIGAMVQRSRSSGLLRGQGNEYLVLSNLPRDADVKLGDVVVSSGMGRMVPKGLVAGRVIKVARDQVMGSTTALVRPSVRFDQIEQVFVVKPGWSAR